MASDYQHCLMLMEKLLPNEDWGRIYDEWGNFSDLDDGDNEPFRLLRAALTAALGKGEGWIACGERMPEESVDVLVRAEDGTHVAFWSGELGWWAANAQADTEELEAPVTHWRPLPPPPTTISEEGTR